MPIATDIAAAPSEILGLLIHDAPRVLGHANNKLWGKLQDDPIETVKICLKTGRDEFPNIYINTLNEIAKKCKEAGATKIEKIEWRQQLDVSDPHSFDYATAFVRIWK